MFFTHAGSSSGTIKLLRSEFYGNVEFATGKGLSNPQNYFKAALKGGEVGRVTEEKEIEKEQNGRETLGSSS